MNIVIVMKVLINFQIVINQEILIYIHQQVKKKMKELDH